MVEPYQLRSLGYVEVHVNSGSDLRLQLREVVCLGEDRSTDRASGIAPLWSLLDEEHEFCHAGIIVDTRSDGVAAWARLGWR